MLEFDTTDNRFRDELLVEPPAIHGQVKSNGGNVRIPKDPGIGVTPDRFFYRACQSAADLLSACSG